MALSSIFPHADSHFTVSVLKWIKQPIGSANRRFGIRLREITARACREMKGVSSLYTKEAFIHDCMTVFAKTDGKTVKIPGIGDVELYDAPLIGFAAADDRLFEQFLQPEIIGPNYYTPVKWLPSGKTVVSFFLPFTEAVRVSNRKGKADPSPEWLYGRIEGQSFITRLMSGIWQMLHGKGIEACVPSQDERFGVQYEMTASEEAPDWHADSRWSERHAAYVCGLGTFGASRGLITEKGIAGRFASIIVSEKWQETERRYAGVDDYCIRCGVCAINCPAGAISLRHGKNNILCKAHVDHMKEKYAPRYGCGKCQVGVPCEWRAPGQRSAADP